jgi:hypothetical protein
MSNSISPLLALNLAELAQICAQRYEMSPELVQTVALELFHAKAISYPLTYSQRLWNEKIAESEKVIAGLSNWSTSFANLAKTVDLSFVSPAWVDEKDVGDHAGITPTDIFSVENFTNHQADVFAVVAERYLMLFDPTNAALDENRIVENRQFTFNSFPSTEKTLLGECVDIFGPSFYVDGVFIFISVRDNVGALGSWLIMPTAFFEEFRIKFNFRTIEDFLSINPKFVSLVVKKANALVLPGGRGLWKNAEGIFSTEGNVRFYHWPDDHLSL